MQAIESVSKAHDGVVDLPHEHQGWNGKEVRVILLEAASEASFAAVWNNDEDAAYDRM